MLSREMILAALSALSDELVKRDVLGEVDIVGGTAMVLAFNARKATKDVDAIFQPTSEIRDAAASVANRLSLPLDWLNDAAKGFLSAAGDFVIIDTLDLPNLRIQAPTPEYMLALKVMAARVAVGGESGDKEDITFLIRLLGISQPDDVMRIVTRYYDPSRILPRSFYLVDEIIEEMQSR